MGTRLTVTVETEEVEAVFAEIAARMSRADKALDYVGRSMVETFRKNIDREDGGPFGKWPDLRPMTNDERERLGFPRAHPMLIRNHDLYNSITSAPTGPQSVEAGPDGSIWYAGQHDSGLGIIPQRAYVWLSDQTIEGWLDAISANLVDGTPYPEPN